MKKNLLLLTTAFTLSLGVQAQTDVTAQYILNPGFEDCTPSESNAQGAIDLHTDYATAQGTDYNDCGWKLVEQAKSANGGAISYASGLKVQYSKWNIAGDDGPTAGPSGTTGTKGLCFCGNKSVVYQQAQAITLPAGSYTLTVNVWARNGETSNPKPTQQVVNVRTGFMPEGGKEDDLIPAVRTSMQFASNGWDKEVLTIELTQATTGRFQLSYGSSYFVVIDDLKLEFAGGVVTTTLYNAIVKAQTLNTSLDNSTLATAIKTAQDFIANPTNQEDVATQTETLYTAMATALAATTTPVEITGAYLDNASFETGKIAPWEWGSASGTIGEPINPDSKVFIDGENVVEYTQAGSNSFSQSIAHLPAGYYIIDAKLNQKAYLKVGDNRTYLQGGDDALYLRVHPEAPYHLTEGKELTVSASASAAFRVDNFRLFYGKDEASLLARLLQDVKADAQALLAMTQFDIITGSERTALLTAIDGTDANAINTAANAFFSAQDDYSNLAKSKTAAEAYSLDLYPYADKTIYQQMQTLIATQPTSAANAKELKTQLDNLCLKFYVSNAYCEGVQGAIDCTDKIVDANATETATGWAVKNMTIRTDQTGWNDPKTGKADKVVYGVTTDYYRTSSNEASILKQTLKGLAAGKYVLSMTMMGSNNLDVNVFFNSELIGTMKAVGKVGGGKYGAGWNEYVITFEKADDTDMPLQLQCKPTANYQEWYIDNFRLYRLPDSTPELEKCATPTIVFEGGKLKFSCDTEGVQFFANVQATEAKDYQGSEIAIGGTYTVTVYAAKEGMANSDPATLEFTAGGNDSCDANKDGVVNVADIITIINKVANKQ